MNWFKTKNASNIFFSSLMTFFGSINALHFDITAINDGALYFYVSKPFVLTDFEIKDKII